MDTREYRLRAVWSGDRRAAAPGGMTLVRASDGVAMRDHAGEVLGVDQVAVPELGDGCALTFEVDPRPRQVA